MSCSALPEVLRRQWPLLVVLLLSPTLLFADGFRPPRRSLDRPLQPQPVFISVGPTIGSSPGFALFRPGFSGALIFHPSAAADFIPSLFPWNTAIVLHGEYRIVDERRALLTTSFLLRKYLNDMRHTPPRVALFIGAGAGLALANYPGRSTVELDDGSTSVRITDISNYYLSFLSEFGYEIALSESLMLTAKAQWRSYVYRSLDYSNWTLHLQIGIPLPW